MAKFNRLMHEEFRNIVNINKKLNEELAKIASKGFLSIEDKFILNYFSNRLENTKKISFIDSIGFEVFINCIHIDDYVSSDMLVQAILFLDAVFEGWKKNNCEKGVLMGIISCDDFRATVKFYTYRNNEIYLSEDLEGYYQPVLLINSKEWGGILDLMKKVNRCSEG